MNELKAITRPSYFRHLLEKVDASDPPDPELLDRIERLIRASEPPSRYSLPVSPGRVVYIEGPFPLTSSEWEHMTTLLRVMIPGLVETPPIDLEETA